MAKITILAGKVQVGTTAKALESFTVAKGQKIIDLYACVWDNATHKPLDGQAEISINEYVGEKKKEVMEPTKCRLIAELGHPLEIMHEPDEGNTLKLIGSSPASEYIAYFLRVATPIP